MSVRLLLIAGLAALLLSGCRHDPHVQLYIDNVNAEKRLLEDTLYDLQYDYECSMQEVEKLRDEVAQLKSGSTTGGTGRPATGSGGRSDAPAVPGGNMFPDFPDLKPPTVESGTPARPKPPATDGPRALDGQDNQDNKDRQDNKDSQDKDDVDDLEPPMLDLGNGTSGVSAAPKLLEEQAVERASDTAATPKSKPVSRWTPRAERPSEVPARRVNVAESPGQQPTGSDPPAGSGSTDAAPGAAKEKQSGTGATSKQAQRPQWRPYR